MTEMEKTAKRIKPCAVCRHEAREGIERAILRGEAAKMIGERFTVSPWAVYRHKKNHLAGEMASVLKEQSGQRVSWLMEEWHVLRNLDGRAGRRIAGAEQAGGAVEGAGVPEPPDRPGAEVGGDAAADA